MKIQQHIEFFALSIVLTLFIVSCRSTSPSTAPYHPLMEGLASPIVVEKQWSTLYLSDYLTVADQINIAGPEHVEIKYTPGAAQAEIRLSTEGPAVSTLTISSNNNTASIPIFTSLIKEVQYSFNPKNKLYKSVQLVGDINAWNPANTNLILQENGTWSTDLYLNPGRYGYQVVLDGVWQLDPANEVKIDNGQGGFNSLLVVEGGAPKDEPIILSASSKNNQLICQANPGTQIICLWENQILLSGDSDGKFSFTLPAESSQIKRSHLRLYPYNNSYGRGPDRLIPLEYGKIVMDTKALDRMDKQSLIMYFLMVDRFYNGDLNNDRKTDDPDILPVANHHGGDLTGVIQKLDEDYFSNLGMNTIWLSPIPKNPEGAFGLWDKGGVKSEFSAYHGYWPISFTKIDDRFGTESDLIKLVEACHKKDMNILLDFVANHVHELHPVYQAHKDDGWATDLYLPDGSLNTEKWDEHRLTTWFDVFLPTLNLEREDVANMLSDSAVYWLEKYNIDGFRHDATKHIPLNFWRTLTQKVKAISSKENRPIYQVGETYGTAELISSYINSGMLDGQFDFNVYDALLASVCRDDVGFERLAEKLKQSQNYYGTNHLMGNMSGNQDKPRLMSMATGEVRFDEDSKLAGWTRDINLQNEIGFKKTAMMHAVNLFIPGVPCLYYGDEIGMPGGNDPDNRRMMKFDNLSTDEQTLLDQVASMAKARQSSMSLLYGDFHILEAKDNRFLASRTYFNESTYLAINNSDQNQEYHVSSNLNSPTIMAGQGQMNDETISLSPREFLLFKNN